MTIREAYTQLENRYETIPTDSSKIRSSIWMSRLISSMQEDLMKNGIEKD